MSQHSTSRALSPVAARCVWVFEHMWKGSQAAFAARIGTSQSAISHVITGRQQPGRLLLQKIANGIEGLNTEWLFTGVGEPTIRDPKTTPYYDRVSTWVHLAVGEALDGDATFYDCLEWLRENGTTEQKAVATMIELFGF